MRRRALWQPALALVLVGAALVAISRLVRNVRPEDVQAALVATPGWALLAAAALTGASYLLLGGYEALALRAIRAQVPLRAALRTGATAYAFSHTVGFALLSGAAVRIRRHAKFGLAPRAAAGTAFLCGLTSTVGFLFVGGAVLLLAPRAPDILRAPPPLVRSVGLLAILAVLLLLAWGRTLGGTLRFRGRDLPIPHGGTAAAQVAIGVAEWLLAPLVLTVLLLPLGVGYGVVLVAFIAAQFAVFATHVPGGLGVFEAVVLALAPADPAPLLAALLVHRVVYYVLPFLVALAAWGLEEARARRTARPREAI